jgi:hypothetical protein
MVNLAFTLFCFFQIEAAQTPAAGRWPLIVRSGRISRSPPSEI